MVVGLSVLVVGWAPQMASPATMPTVETAPEMEALIQGYQMAKFDPFLSLDCARVEGVGAQGMEGIKF